MSRGSARGSRAGRLGRLAALASLVADHHRVEAVRARACANSARRLAGSADPVRDAGVFWWAARAARDADGTALGHATERLRWVRTAERLESLAARAARDEAARRWAAELADISGRDPRWRGGWLPAPGAGAP